MYYVYNNDGMKFLKLAVEMQIQFINESHYINKNSVFN